MSYIELTSSGVPIRAWTDGVQVGEKALLQLQDTARLPIIHGHVAVMPDVHWGLGATIGSVIPTVGAVIPAAVGVDIGCGMCAVQTTLTAGDLPDDLKPLRSTIERAVPHGRSSHGGRRDQGAWHDIPRRVGNLWKEHLALRFQHITDLYPKVEQANHINHLGTLGTGNHFIEVCLDQNDRVWFMVHSGSRGVGNKLASIFIEKAKQDMGRQLSNLPHKDLAYLKEGSQHYDEYVFAVGWAQDFARINRQIMMENVVFALSRVPGLKPFRADSLVVNCHHNYIAKEEHFGRECLVTRKGAVRAAKGDLGIIPGSMGAKSFIVRGKGNPDSFRSCSHGAGRAMSRTEAKRRYSIEDHLRATAHVECRKDAAVIDETPMAYKDIDAVMRAQADLVDIEHTLRQVVCVKG